MKINIKDYDSGYTMDKEYEKHIILNGGFLLQKLYSLPVYLVNEETMDKISPPTKGLNRDCVNEYLERIYNREMKKIKDYGEEEYITMDKWGFGIPPPGFGQEKYFHDERPVYSTLDFVDIDSLYSCKTSLYELVGAYVQDDFIDSGKHILICPDRIRFKGKEFRDIFLAVLFHEATHAYLDTVSNMHNELTFKIIEESLCEAVSLSRFSVKKQRINVIQFMSDPHRPLEYTGYSYWLEIFRLASIKNIVDQIKVDDPTSILSLLFPNNSYLNRYLHYTNKKAFLYPRDVRRLYDKIALDILRQ